MLKAKHLVVAVLLLSGCAQHRWVHVAGTGTFERDAFECNQTGYHASGDFETMAALNQQCMLARGWKLETVQK